jgi:hypothetical protein
VIFNSVCLHKTLLSILGMSRFDDNNRSEIALPKNTERSEKRETKIKFCGVFLFLHFTTATHTSARAGARMYAGISI